MDDDAVIKDPEDLEEGVIDGEEGPDEDELDDAEEFGADEEEM